MRCSRGEQGSLRSTCYHRRTFPVEGLLRKAGRLCMRGGPARHRHSCWVEGLRRLRIRGSPSCHIRIERSLRAKPVLALGRPPTGRIHVLGKEVIKSGSVVIKSIHGVLEVLLIFCGHIMKAFLKHANRIIQTLVLIFQSPVLTLNKRSPSTALPVISHAR